MIDLKTIIENSEKDLRAGRISQAAQALRALRPSEVPRPMILTVANLCRRSGLNALSLRLLTPYVRGENIIEPAAPAEIAEYAAALQKIGAVNEAMGLLKEVDARLVPEAPLFLAFCHFRKWEYAEAIPLLEDYNSRAPDAYLKMVGQMNLAAALAVAHEFGKFTQLTDQLLDITRSRGYSRLLANALELRAQVNIARNKWIEARKNLDAASEVLGTDRSIDGFFLRKWEALLVAMEKGDNSALQPFRTEALARRDWESCREADFFSLKVNFSEAVFQRLLFGTPYPAYRERLLKDLGKTWTTPSFTIGPAGAPKFLVSEGRFENCAAELPGKLMHALIATLLRDLYKPWSIPALFAETFPDQHFDIFSSPNRVHQLLWRMRQWIQDNKLPVALTEIGGHYRLESTGAFSFRVSRDLPVLDENVLHLRRLQEQFRQNPFTIKEAQGCLGISASSFKRLARWALSAERLIRNGESRATHYKIAA